MDSTKTKSKKSNIDDNTKVEEQISKVNKFFVLKSKAKF